MSGRIVITSPQLPRLLRNVDQWDSEVSRATQKFLKKGTLLVQSNVMGKAPVKTGKLKQSIRAKVDKYQGRVWPTVKHAIFVNDGTKAHIIRPRVKKALYWQGASHPVARVNHPGQKANPFFDEGVESSRREIEKFGEELLEDLSRHLRKGL